MIFCLFSKETKELYLKKGIKKIAVVDIETSDLEGDFDYMICWVIHIYDVEKGTIVKKSDYMRKHEKINMVNRGLINFDKRIVKTLLEELKSVNMVVGHYSDRFDVPFIRTRAFINKLQYPKYKTIRYFDTWRFARYGLKLGRNNLGSLSYAMLGKNQKTVLHHKVRILSREGNRKAIKYTLHHNKLDVNMTRKIFFVIAPYCNIPTKWL